MAENFDYFKFRNSYAIRLSLFHPVAMKTFVPLRCLGKLFFMAEDYFLSWRTLALPTHILI
jgi:hypothetical protein